MIELSPRRLLGYRDDLLAFHNAYVAYLEATIDKRPDPEEASRLRGEVMSRIAAVQDALNVARVDPVVYPPPMIGGPVLHGLVNVAFQHEAPYARRDTIQYVLDATRLGGSYLEERAIREAQRRRNPLYWADRTLRMILGIPSYLISLIIGVPAWRIDRSPWGALIRVVEVVAAILGVYWGGSAAGWW